MGSCQHRVQLNHWQPSSRTNHRPCQDLGPCPHTPGGSFTPFCHENMISRFQAIAQTLARDALRTVWDLAARIITTATLFGVFESVEKQINHCHFLMSFLGFSNCGKHNHRGTLEIHHRRKNCHSHGFKVLFSSIISSLH